VSTFDTATAARTIEALDTDTEGGGRSESHARQFRIVVLDTVTALLGPHLSGIFSQGNAQRSRRRFIPPPPPILSVVYTKFPGIIS
jgi:hypothetical protein